MCGIQNYAGFLAAVVLFQLLPGAGTVTILYATGTGGFGRGLKTVFGTLCGDALYMLAAVVGVAAFLAASPVLFELIQWIGIVYLLFFGLKLLLKSKGESGAEERMALCSWAPFLNGFGVSLTNPKVILFFMAFFPQFLPVDYSPLTLFILMLHVTGISLIYQIMLVMLAFSARRSVDRILLPRFRIERLAGLVLIGLALQLALKRR